LTVMSEPTPPRPPEPPPAGASAPLDASAADAAARSVAGEAPVSHLAVKAGLMLGLGLALIALAIWYVLYARGFFELTHKLELIADNAEGVTVGMDMTFAGFPIGRVQRVALAPDGNASILVNVAEKDAHWLRETSVFVLERPLVGSAKLKAFSGVLTDPPLPDNATRKVLRGDVAEEIPRMVANVQALLQNLQQLTSAGSSLAGTLLQVEGVARRLNGQGGLLAALTGNEKDAQQVAEVLRRAHTLLDNANRVAEGATRLTQRLDTTVADANTRVLGEHGLIPQAQGAAADAQRALRELQGLLEDARASLKKLDTVIVNAQGISADVKGATTDLGALRADVESSLRQIEQMINDINKRWPFAKKTPLTLP